MNKYIFILLAALTFGACSEDEKADDGSILPVKKISKEVTNFFASEIGEAGQREYFFPPRRITDDDFPVGGPLQKDTSDTCCIVNSMEELAQIYKGSKNLPQIDFTSQTLIVGKVTMPDDPFYVKGQSITETESALIHNLRVKDSENSWCQVYQMRYWGLYPKLPNKPIVVNVIYL